MYLETSRDWEANPFVTSVETESVSGPGVQIYSYLLSLSYHSLNSPLKNKIQFPTVTVCQEPFFPPDRWEVIRRMADNVEWETAKEDPAVKEMMDIIAKSTGMRITTGQIPFGTFLSSFSHLIGTSFKGKIYKVYLLGDDYAFSCDFGPLERRIYSYFHDLAHEAFGFGDGVNLFDLPMMMHSVNGGTFPFTMCGQNLTSEDLLISGTIWVDFSMGLEPVEYTLTLA